VVHIVGQYHGCDTGTYVAAFQHLFHFEPEAVGLRNEMAESNELIVTLPVGP
jgi:hypothetical protein